ncbi:MAG: 30S ribosomal protein S3 [Nanoarchaeota archaeon]|nr:30S ribosomal protein S3 [Nanoarchaeota archaeon]
MIERKFIKEKINDYRIQEYLLSVFKNSSYSHTIIQKTPLGEKIIIFSSKPGLVVGRGGSNIKSVVEDLKTKFSMQSPQIEVQEINEPDLDPSIVAENIADMLVRMGTSRFKFIGHRIIQKVIDSGAIGAEIIISGKVPSKRAKTWKFTMGYLPKSGDPANTLVLKGYRLAQLKPGVIGVTVKILPPNSVMPDSIIITGEIKVQEVKQEPEKLEEKESSKPAEKKEEKTEPKKETKKKTPAEKKSPAKKKPVKEEKK